MRIIFIPFFQLFLLFACSAKDSFISSDSTISSKNVLDFRGPDFSPTDRSSLAFSDQGAWFAYGFNTKKENYGGFAGPFLMTQANGVWCSEALSMLTLFDAKTDKPINWEDFSVTQTSYNSHLHQNFKSADLEISQILFFTSPHTAVVSTHINNLTSNDIILRPEWRGKISLISLKLEEFKNAIIIRSDKSSATGYIQFIGNEQKSILLNDSTYSVILFPIEVKSGETAELLITHSFIFPEYDAATELKYNEELANDFHELFQKRKSEKQNQLSNLSSKLDSNWQKPEYKSLSAKIVLTMQNNWRSPAGELKHAGLFPSYHYEWFHGFWAWDSWKHAVALAQYDTHLAKDQVRAMFDYMDKEGFIADCIYRDTTIEKHNFRNTKPPLSAWAVWNIYEQDGDINFLQEMFENIKLQHEWWYRNRDHDKDGICEYGSTDGSLIAAKWESGMDNAVRFDESKILKNSENAYSLNQESVDLNSYLFAEKIHLSKIANTLSILEDADRFILESDIIGEKINSQFYDSATGWYYDTSLDGKSFVKVMGCEGWIPLWAKVATPEQAEAVKNNMMDSLKFNTKVPFQTLSASHLDFNPDGGYWRGPSWLDQSYFGVKGLLNYGYTTEAYEASYRLFHNAEGLLDSGIPIRENYNPITGAGLEAYNFSWSAAHYLLLLLNDK